MIGKYRWYVQTCKDIEWELQSKFIQQHTYFKKKTMKKFIHQWLLSGKKNYEEPLMCPYCKSLDNPSIQHDHFITCSVSNERKIERLSIIGKKMNMLAISTTIKALLIKRITKLDYLREFNINKT